MIKLLLELMERQPARVVEHLVVAFWVLLRSPLYQQVSELNRALRVVSNL
jgi:hypothetical protein